MPVFSKVHSSVTVNFIRGKNEKDDDKLLIRPTSTKGVVYLRYQDSVNKSKHEIRVTKDELANYFISLFHLLSYDTEPFTSVQVNFPAFPCIMLSVQDLGYESLRLRLQNIIQFTMETSFVESDSDMPELESVQDCDCY